MKSSLCPFSWQRTKFISKWHYWDGYIPSVNPRLCHDNNIRYEYVWKLQFAVLCFLQRTKNQLNSRRKVGQNKSEWERRGGGQCHTWQAEKPSNKWSRSSQCGKMNDAISAWINVPYVPLKGTLSINHITIPSTRAMCAHTPSNPDTHTHIHTSAHKYTHYKPSQLVWI